MNRNFRTALFFILLLLFTVGCREDISIPSTNSNGNVELSDGSISYSLYTNTPDFVQPLTRVGSANEDDVSGDTWVFVFDASSSDTTLLEVVKASEHSTTTVVGQSRRTVILKQRIHPVKLFFIDNTPAEIFDGVNNIAIVGADSWPFSIGDGIDDVRSRLNVKKLNISEQNQVPYTPNELIPMTGERYFDELNLSTNLGTETVPLELRRIVAKLVVKKEFEAILGYTHPDFELKGATVYNTPRNGSLFLPHQNNSSSSARTDYKGVGSGNEVLGIAPAVNNQTTSNPIYLYSSKETLRDYHPYVIIQAEYNNDGYDTYYKLSINPRGKNEGEVDRNTNYSFLITSCTGRGYESLADAIAAPPSNLITYNIKVTDLTSHDLMDNGQYFLAVSNSEYHFYAEGAQSNLIASTLAWGGNVVAPVTITAIGSGLTFTSTGTNSLSFPISLYTADIAIDLSDNFVSGTIVVKIGNLIKEIKVKRRFSLPPFRSIIEDFTGKEYVYASKTQAISWMNFSTDGNNVINGDQLQNNNGGIYLVVDNIYGDNTTGLNAPPRNSTFYLSRTNNQGRLKVYAVQKRPLDNPLTRSYAGAFWRNNQTGERLIRDFTYRTATPSPSYGVELDNEGEWIASVIWADDRWVGGRKEIRLSVNNLPLYPAGGDATVAESRQVDSDYSTTVSGTVGVNDPIYFRIGLASKYTPTPQYPARYAIVRITYADHRKSRHLFIRQGEGDDYVMRPSDPIASAGRSLAVKFSPYNLTAPNWSLFTAPGVFVNQHPLLTTNGGAMVNYPSQSGAFFQFAVTDGYGQMNRAFHPMIPLILDNESTSTNSLTDWFYNASGVTGWWSDFASVQELCPNGYRRPTDGITNAATAGGNDYTTSEIRQSLFFKPENGTGSGTNYSTRENSVWGFYADGFFDRQALTSDRLDLGSGDARLVAVSSNNQDVACRGSVMFNPYNGASLFFPAAGERNATKGNLQFVGLYLRYWAASGLGQDNGWTFFIDDIANNLNARMQTSLRGYGHSVRCVKVE